MGIYIEGMEMPTFRDDYVAIVIYGDATIRSVHGFVIDGATAVPVPDHGRLIDADVLRSQCDDPHWCVWMSEIDDSPTIIPSDKEGVNNGTIS